MEKLANKYPQYVKNNGGIDSWAHGSTLKSDGKRFLKKVTHQLELDFYTTTSTNPLFNGLIPNFLGYDKETSCLSLENITYGYTHPCILDLKIGDKTYCDDVRPQRRAERKKNDEEGTTAKYGFRFSGMTLSTLHKSYEVSPYLYLELHTLDDLVDVMKVFFDNMGDYKDDIQKTYIAQLSRFCDVFPTCNCTVISSSILFVYDLGTSTSDCRWIDFSHYRDNTTNPVDFTDGVQNGAARLLRVLRDL
ncbi:hypothetical protein EIN_281880 [Entamoeba invadens IP1]|uniref:Kinase n=1 Tax=Entamoeba invadens IP1 TaxID=370355 RepID=A0A0A1TX38_ENTIV|nr:hypothetical protein EIN_281880 [Entamoeba invadens IP1]ELP85817.1 hypothetical protein EIN_281880 [Entamoeba invadens IP1]|eukprot:XP_004185163.1 hypothetical protein EIN_281880 [Entamoeba invadens IP1]